MEAGARNDLRKNTAHEGRVEGGAIRGSGGSGPVRSIAPVTLAAWTCGRKWRLAATGGMAASDGNS